MRASKLIPLLAAAVVLAALAQSVAKWPPTTGEVVVGEWYSDIPWHQKLGTFAGNQIDAPIILPYEALGTNEIEYCNAQALSPEDCMLEVGIRNILGMYRTDTPYTDLKAPAAPECSNAEYNLPCIQVTLDLHSYSTEPVGNEVKLVARKFGTEPQHGYKNQEYGGYVITDGSIYAPQMPWYMAHYCDAFVPQDASKKDVQDPACYGDYFSPMNNGFNTLKDKPAGAWPRSAPWQPAIADNIGRQHCASGETKCTLALAGFELTSLSPTLEGLQYSKYNENLLTWFNNALREFADSRNLASNKHKFPWAGTMGKGTATQVNWPGFLYDRAKLNPFLGQFPHYETEAANPIGCDVTVSGPTLSHCIQATQERATQYVYPRRCKLDDLNSGAPTEANVAKLRQCGLNYELHHNGFLEQWPNAMWDQITTADVGITANQYGRTSFLFAGVPGMQMPVSFYVDPGADNTIYERVQNASIFSLFLPMANVADNNPLNTYYNRYYKDREWFHVLLMANHMEATPDQFADGIRGKALWHNEYRTQGTYDAKLRSLNPDRWFNAAFQPKDAHTPWHNNTCDGCHLRNGSGVPINTQGKLDPLQKEYMNTGAKYNPYVDKKDYTFTGEIRPMKLVFFDLNRDAQRLDASRYSEPLSFSEGQIRQASRTLGADSVYYENAVMNFYGDSFHVTTPGYGYTWSYVDAATSRLVVPTSRNDAELGRQYVPQQVAVKDFTVGSCSLMPKPATSKPWPATCNDVDGAAIAGAIESSTIGFMHLNGKRLGNLSVIEAIPSKAIMGFQTSQKALLGEKIAGEIVWNAGARDGIDGPNSRIFRTCRTNSSQDCFISRFGWLGDRVSLEDQVANAAFVEMNMTSSEGYDHLYPSESAAFPIRYKAPNCGPANKDCVESQANRDLSEIDIKRMADYARWVGNPTRSELKVSLPAVIAGEKVFRQLKCDTCHVIQKITIDDPEDTMLSQAYRVRLAKQITTHNKPFLSYIGTDLLMHDMGYLSQVGIAKQPIRDSDGVVLPEYKNYVQKIRTPPLKGLRFNRFVTDAHRNVNKAGDPGCDFLLHDGRACDAIEAAFLHDGPAIKKLGTIDSLNALTPELVMQLRAFLYSL
ncbi:MAG TPA: di-heme oxidoredictase family protein [Vicinamibacterales bacterium]|nr:di-heme oxidoredictase family protein [Vicinamibacterales bacterium]